MESQMAPPHSHIHEQDPDHNVSHTEVEEHHHSEKPSVLKKVKAKAKKIKDTIKKHGHGHNHDHDLDEEDDDEEVKTVQDPEVHGAPIYDSSAIKTGGLEYLSEAPERSTAMPHGDPLASEEATGIGFSDPTKVSVPLLDENSVQPKSNFRSRETVPIEEPQSPLNTPVSSFSHGVYETEEDNLSDPSRTFVSGSGVNSGESKVNLDRPRGLEEDPHAPRDPHHHHQAYGTPSNYQTKVSDPTGAGTEEVGVEPILLSFDRMNIHGQESEPKQQLGPTTQGPTGSHSQFSPEPFPSNASNTPQIPEKMEENFDIGNRNDRVETEFNPNTSNPTSYTDKITYATAVIADKAVSAKNAVASKLGYGDRDENRAAAANEQARGYGSGDGAAKPAAASSATEYGKKMAATVTEKLTPVYEKVAGAGSTVMSKVQGNNNASGGGQDRGVSVKDYFAEKLRPGDEDRALSEVISETLHVRKVNPDKKAGDDDVDDHDEDRPVGRVTQSEEVTRRLGTGEEKSDRETQKTAVAGYMDSPGEGDQSGNGKGMVDKLKGAVGSLFGYGGADQTQSSQVSQPSSGSSQVGGEPGYSEHYSSSKNERRLQESGN